MRSSAFYPSVFYNTGTVSVTPGSNIVTGSGTVFAANFTNCQWRPGAPPANYPTYTILAVLSSTSLLLDKPWVGPALSGQSYQIFQCYFSVPADFQYFYSLVNPTANFRLWTNITQAHLDLCDPQRSSSGLSYGAAFLDYTQNFQGTVGPVLQVVGSGPDPVSTTTLGYSFPSDSVFGVRISTGGAVGTCEFIWNQDGGTYLSATVVTDSDTVFDLAGGVQVYFPAGTYVVGDTFVIACKADSISGVPRYELWPRAINTPYVYPYIYAAKLPDLSDAAPQLPPFIARRGDVLLEMALEKLALWPGTETRANPYASAVNARTHHIQAETMIYELEKKDDDTATKDIVYQNLGYAPAPWMDGAYLQNHAWPYAG